MESYAIYMIYGETMVKHAETEVATPYREYSRRAVDFGGRYLQVSKIIPTFAGVKTTAMPEVFNLYGYSFFFYSKEHEPVHVHVEGSDGYATFDWDEEAGTFVERERYNIKAGDLRKIRKAIADRSQDIFDKWNEHFNQ